MMKSFKDEYWKPIKDFEQEYLVSNYGRVYGLKRKTYPGGLKSLRARKDGYINICLYKNNTSIHKYVHRLVIETFVGNIPYDMEVNHIDGNKSNNKLDNLEIVTRSENCIHKYSLRLQEPTKFWEGIQGSGMPNSMWFLVIDPCGKEFVVKGLTKFCKDNNLSQSRMSMVSNGKQNNYKGWRCFHISQPIDEEF